MIYKIIQTKFNSGSYFNRFSVIYYKDELNSYHIIGMSGGQKSRNSYLTIDGALSSVNDFNTSIMIQACINITYY